MKTAEEAAREYATDKYPECWIEAGPKGMKQEVNTGRRKMCEQSFVAGAKWSQEQGQAEIIMLQVSNASLERQNSELLSQLQQSQAEVAQLKQENELLRKNHIVLDKESFSNILNGDNLRRKGE